jgi:AcrR family transcriptional regulator
MSTVYTFVLSSPYASGVANASGNSAEPTSGRRAYHHGDLRDALLTAAVERARAGGAAAVVMRDLARATGVSPRAAYRHFDGLEAVLDAVAAVALTELSERIIARLEVETSGTLGLAALHVIGHEYVAYARAEPGMFDATFLGRSRMADHAALRADAGMPTPHQLLTAAVGAIDEEGLLSVAPEVAVLSCWSAVHGLAALVVHGPLQQMPDDQVDALTDRVVAAAIAGVTTSRA